MSDFGNAEPRCECGKPRPCELHDVTPAMCTAMELLQSLTPGQRQLLFCWFCGVCAEYMPPGYTHRCGLPDTLAPSGIASILPALSALARRESRNIVFAELAHSLTEPSNPRGVTMLLLVDALHRRFLFEKSDPLSAERIGPVPISPGTAVDADDACLFVATLAMSLGIRCRFVGARYGRFWTCLVAYEDEDGRWVTVDPLRQVPERVPAETVMEPIPERT